MANSIKILDTREEIINKVISLCEASLESGNRPIVLCPNIQIAHYVKISLAQNPIITVGVSVLTVQEWLINNWRLFQHTNTIISPTLRKALLLKLLQINSKSLEMVPYRGYGEVLDTLVCQGLDIVCNKAKERYKELSKKEHSVFNLLWAYSDALRSNNMVEVSQIGQLVIDDLSRTHDMSNFDFFAICFDSVPLYIEKVFDRLSTLSGSFVRFEEYGGPVKKSTRTPKLFCPSGPEVTCRSILKEIKDFYQANDGIVVVASNKPFEMFNSLYAGIVDVGISANFNAEIEVCKSNFGKALNSLLRLVYTYSDKLEHQNMLMYAKDFVLSSYSGVPYELASRLCSKWDKQANVSVDSIIQDMENACIVHVGTAFNSYNKIGLIRACLNQNSISTVVKILVDQQYGTVENNLISRSISENLVDLFNLLQNIGFTTADIINLLDSVCCHVNNTYTPQGYLGDQNKIVKFMSTKSASYLMPNSIQLLILPDFDSVSYSVKNPDNTAYTLLDIIGIDSCQDTLTFHRRMISRLLENSNKTFIGRPEFSTDAEELYDCVMLQQVLMSLGITDFKQAKDALNTVGFNEKEITKSLLKGQDFTVLQGQVNANKWSLEIDNDVFKNIFDKPMSASSLESYLNCPFRWFVERRLRANRPSAGIGPLETGSFAHSVLKSFYESFKDDGNERVTKKNIQEAHNLLNETIEIMLEEHKIADFVDSQYNPVTPTELAKHQQLVANLHGLLDRDSVFLPKFKPTYFEFRFGYNTEVYYAGLKIVGSIDRIDVDDQNNAVVIDYKGNAGIDYAVSKLNQDVLGEGICLPKSIQALVYAQIVRRVLGLNPVAALYRSYGTNAGSKKNPGSAGALSTRYLSDDKDLDFCNQAACAVPYRPLKQSKNTEDQNSCKFDLDIQNLSFLELLDNVEHNIEEVLKRNRNINVSPKSCDTCRYCEIVNCEKRSNG